MDKLCLAASALTAAWCAGAACGQGMTAVALPATFTRPVFVTAPPGDTSRLFIVEQRGSAGVATRGDIRIFDLRTNSVNAAPFLSVTGLATQSEQGLLGMAFDPNYGTNGFFYVNYTSSGGFGTTRVVRYRVSADPDVADAGSATPVLSQAQTQVNHNGGWLGFGPDGYLYIPLGDGGGGGDPNNAAQNPATWLGKVLRIDVSSLPYTVPSTNPYSGLTNPRPEIWASGLRNPWRVSFDREAGDFWIADVGQELWEEVNVQPAATAPPFAARNYGWRCHEGHAPYNPTGCAAPATMTFPVHVYQHTLQGGECAVTGGYVYRGCAMPEMRGHYFFADYCAARIWTMRYSGGVVTDLTERTAELAPAGGPGITGITSFGEDGRGELYICGGGGLVFRIVPRCEANCDASTAAPVLNIGDFTCFLQRFAAGDCYANCDQSTTPPVLNVSDFTCFLQKFAAGCP